jgi:uncharacterized membrane protein
MSDWGWLLLVVGLVLFYLALELTSRTPFQH